MYFCGICSCFILGGRVKSSIEGTTDTLGYATVCAQKGGVWNATESGDSYSDGSKTWNKITGDTTVGDHCYR